MATVSTAQVAPSVDQSTLRKASWLLVGTAAAAVLFLLTAGLTFPAEVERSSQLTPDQMAAISIGWVVANLLWAMPALLAATAFVRIGVSRVAALLASLAAGSMLVYFGLTASLASFTTDTLGQDSRFGAASLISLFSAWAASVATVLLGVALFRSRVLRKTGITVAVITAAFLALDVITYLPALTGEIPMDEVENLPPVIITLLWLALGVGLLRRRVPSQS